MKTQVWLAVNGTELKDMSGQTVDVVAGVGVTATFTVPEGTYFWLAAGKKLQVILEPGIASKSDASGDAPVTLINGRSGPASSPPAPLANLRRNEEKG